MFLSFIKKKKKSSCFSHLPFSTFTPSNGFAHFDFFFLQKSSKNNSSLKSQGFLNERFYTFIIIILSPQILSLLFFICFLFYYSCVLPQFNYC